MTKKQLEAYKSEKQEIKELREKLQNLKPESYVGNTVINDYRSGYPVPQGVVGIDLDAFWRKRDRLTSRISRLEKNCQEIEQWIEEIPDSLTRRIFRMYYEEGKRQQDIAKQLHIDQSVVSRNIKKYIDTTIT